MATRTYLAGSTADLAKAQGVSVRTIQRHIAAGKVAGAMKVNGRWQVPLTTGQYAKARGVSVRTAQRRGTTQGVRAASPQAAAVRVLPDLRDYRGRYIPESWYIIRDLGWPRVITLRLTFRDIGGVIQVRSYRTVRGAERVEVAGLIREVEEWALEVYDIDEILRIDFVKGWKAP